MGKMFKRLIERYRLGLHSEALFLRITDGKTGEDLRYIPIKSVINLITMHPGNTMQIMVYPDRTQIVYKLDHPDADELIGEMSGTEKN